MPYTIDREIEDVKAQQIKAILGKHFITKIMEADLKEGQDFGIYSVKPLGANGLATDICKLEECM